MGILRGVILGLGALREGPRGPRFQRSVGLLGCARQGPYAGPLVGVREWGLVHYMEVEVDSGVDG